MAGHDDGTRDAMLNNEAYVDLRSVIVSLVLGIALGFALAYIL